MTSMAISTSVLPKIELFVSTALPQPAWNASPQAAGEADDTHKWAIAVNSYDPAQTTLALNRYVNSQTYETTTGWINAAKFFPDGTLGHLYITPQNGANQPFYGCKAGSKDYFISLDMACNGQRILGVNGYGYAQQPSGVAAVALYSCNAANHGQFLSKDPACEGKGSGTLLGFALP